MKSQPTSLLRSPAFLLAVTAVLAGFGYLSASALTYRMGFPLDDSWIHQTYARNLANSGQWAFVPGQISAGSTAPLWSLLLAVGHLLSAGVPYVWSYLLGFICLAATAILGEIWFRRSLPEWKGRFPWAGLYLVAEWHMVWAAASGMETALMAALVLAVFALIIQPQPRWLLVGALTGLTVWVRPDGLTLLGPAFMVAWLVSGGWRSRFLALGQVAAGFLLLFGPYLLFNRQLAGSWWPNTFYAKQAEYAVQRQIPLLTRFLTIAGLPLIGAGVILLPGFFYAIWRAIQGRKWVLLAAAIWWAGYSLLYAQRLPVTYQHGRYLMPAMPVFFILALFGTAQLVLRLRTGKRWHRIMRRAWVLSIIVTAAAFYLVGARSYGRDVAVIESEMVNTARWLQQNTRSDVLVAVHDIGAVGYFAERKIVDLAGLVSPEVIPFIRDEAALADYLNQREIDYLVTFPDWYPQLIKDGELVYESGGQFAPLMGEKNMAVYRWIGDTD